MKNWAYFCLFQMSEWDEFAAASRQVDRLLVATKNQIIGRHEAPDSYQSRGFVFVVGGWWYVDGRFPRGSDVPLRMCYPVSILYDFAILSVNL